MEFEASASDLVAELRNPGVRVTGGFDIHAVFDSGSRAQAVGVFRELMALIESLEIPHTRPLIFDEPVGPWPTPMWQVLLPQSDRAPDDLRRCIAWLLESRGELSVMIHPNTERQGERGGMVADHTVHARWLGPSLPLRLEDFE